MTGNQIIRAESGHHLSANEAIIAPVREWFRKGINSSSYFTVIYFIIMDIIKLVSNKKNLIGALFKADNLEIYERK